MGGVGLVLLAAGASSRMGSPKQLLEYEGEALVRRAARMGLASWGPASSTAPVWVVVGCRCEQVEAALSGLPVRLLHNPDWETGMGSSIRVGARAGARQDLDALILALADQPLVTAEHYQRLVETFHVTGCPVVASGYAGVAGVPALFARELFPGLVALPPEQGCQGLIARHPDKIVVPCSAAGLDVDTPEDYRRLTGQSYTPAPTGSGPG